MKYYVLKNKLGHEAQGTIGELWYNFELGDYNEDLTDYGIDDLLRDINEAGQDGWVVVSVIISYTNQTGGQQND